MQISIVPQGSGLYRICASTLARFCAIVKRRPLLGDFPFEVSSTAVFVSNRHHLDQQSFFNYCCVLVCACVCSRVCVFDLVLFAIALFAPFKKVLGCVFDIINNSFFWLKTFNRLIHRDKLTTVRLGWLGRNCYSLFVLVLYYLQIVLNASHYCW